MVEIDWSEDEVNVNLQPGTYYAEIKDAALKTSRKGDKMFEIRAAAVDWDGRHLLYDYFMLEGKGRGIGTRKLLGLGFQKGSNIDADDLIGRRFFVATVEEEDSYKGEKRKRLVADLDYGAHCGYAPESAGQPSTTLSPGEAYEGPDTTLEGMADSIDPGKHDPDWDPFQ